jgi:CDI immunity proteins
MNDRRTLNELDPPAWDPPSRDDTNLVRRCHELRQTPLAEFDVEDLRIMIGQQISLPYLIPLAITVLQANPLAEGDHYPGDLLHAVLRADKTYWQTNVGQWQIVDDVADKLATAHETMRDSITAFKTNTFA